MTVPTSPSGQPPRWTGNDSLPPRRHSVWSVLGTVVAVALGVFGLMVVAGFVLLIIGLNNYGSNK